jgi:hypothetical protein
LSALAQGLAAVAAQLDPDQAAQVCGKAVAALGQAIKVQGKSNQFGNASGDSVTLAEGLVAVARFVESKQVAPVCAQAFGLLMKEFERFGLSQLPYPETISAVAAWMEPKEAFAALSQAMKLNRGSRILALLAKAQTAAASRMAPGDAAEDAGTLAEAIQDPQSHQMSNYFDEQSCPAEALSRSLAAVAARLEPDDAGRIANTLAQALNKDSNIDGKRFLSESLSAVAARMDPKAAAEVCGKAAAALDVAFGKATDPNEIGQLAQGLGALAARIESKEATQLCGRIAAILTSAISVTADSAALTTLSHGLASVAARLDPGEADRVCGQSADVLIVAMTKNTSVPALPNQLSLSSGLLAVVDRLELKKTAEVCGRAAHILSLSISKQRGNILPLQQLFHRLTEIVPYMDPEEAAIALMVAKSRVSETNITDIASWATLSKSISELVTRERSPLLPQTLVNILKHPFCVGETRRLVLDQLSRHEHRPFTDQWEFAEYVAKNKLDLDLTTPPERPGTLP